MKDMFSDGAGRRVLALVQYDGTDFLGFQRQARGRTVQGVLEDCLERLLGHEVRVRGAGRTDAGVHARGQAVSFMVRSAIPIGKIPQAVSTLLPPDVVMERALEVPSDFDVVRDAVEKTYCYRIWRSERPDITRRRYVLEYPWPLDLGLIEGETEHLLGKHDFARFRAQGSSAKTTVREVKAARWAVREVGSSTEPIWEFWITADGFLYKMVRLLVGTLLDVGRGRLPPGTVAFALERPERGVKIGECVPGKGLCLEEVTFASLDREKWHR